MSTQQQQQQQQQDPPNFIPDSHQNEHQPHQNDENYSHEVAREAEQLADQDGNQQNTDIAEDGLNPPSRRHLCITVLAILGFAMYLSSAFEPFVTTKSGKSGLDITLWDQCTYNATTSKLTNCEDSASSTGYFCDSSKALINAGRAFMILSLVGSLAAAIFSTSAFLGAAFVARNFKPLSWVSCFFGLFFGIIYLAIQVGFGTRQVCDKWSSAIIEVDGGNTYRVGPAIGFTVVGIILLFIAEVIAAIGPNACLDAFVENRECCDDGTNGGRGSRRRAM